MIKYATIFLLTLLSCTNPPKIDYDYQADHRLVFVGNSYTYDNSLNVLSGQLVNLLEKKKVFSIRVTSAGYTSHDHLKDLLTPGTAMNRIFVKDASQGKKWDLLVLQENSRIPGLIHVGAKSSIPKIQEYGKKVARRTMLMMTWAYVEGDPHNKEVSANYLTMQKHLAQGTALLAKEMSEKGNLITVVPAGLGYQAVYEDLEKEGKDPFAKNSLFRQLYTGDGKHPSLAGSYLTACMIASLYTGKSILNLAGKPKGLSVDFAKYLREVATRVLENEKNSSLPN